MPDRFSERDRYPIYPICPDCDGSGVQGDFLVYADPQTYVDDICPTCLGSGVDQEYIQLIRDAASNYK